MKITEFDPKSNECLICGSSFLRSFQSAAFDSKRNENVFINECRECCFAWQYPLGRDEEESAQHFENYYKDAGRSSSSYFDPVNKREIAKLELEFISSLPIEKYRLLDVGAGAGFFAGTTSPAPITSNQSNDSGPMV